MSQFPWKFCNSMIKQKLIHGKTIVFLRHLHKLALCLAQLFHLHQIKNPQGTQGMLSRVLIRAWPCRHWAHSQAVSALGKGHDCAGPHGRAGLKAGSLIFSPPGSMEKGTMTRVLKSKTFPVYCSLLSLWQVTVQLQIKPQSYQSRLFRPRFSQFIDNERLKILVLVYAWMKLLCKEITLGLPWWSSG